MPHCAPPSCAHQATQSCVQMGTFTIATLASSLLVAHTLLPSPHLRNTCATDISKCPDLKISECAAGIKCPDGTCKPSFGMCANNPICQSGLLKCWDGQCVKSVADCPLYRKCPNITCPDGACARDLSDCPTQRICDEAGKTFLCASDLSCRLNADACPPAVQCPNGERRCPTGLCSTNNGQCGTSISCPADLPFKCVDSSCAKTQDDCVRIECPKDKPYICPTDGSCAASLTSCQDLPSCPMDKPILCPDQQCRANVTDCIATNVCPSTRPKRCPDRRCYPANMECPVPPCPSASPIRCPDKSCVPSKKFCVTLDSGCPPETSRCWDGVCRKTCPTEIPCATGKTRCPDGTCLQDTTLCRKPNGCPRTMPFRCANHSCVANIAKCPPALCPTDLPIRCPDGFCTTSKSNCPRKDQNTNACSDDDKPFLCANGQCAETPTLCPIVSPCPTGTRRCANGLCQPLTVECPSGSTCPTQLPTMCANGRCAKTSADCVASNGCPSNAPVKCEFGVCVDNKNKCPQNPLNESSNGCPLGMSFRCWDRSCSKDEASCKRSNGCPTNMPFRCPDGMCKPTEANCSTLTDCANGNVKCPDGSCVSNKNQCKTKTGCPFNMPQRCPDGTCAEVGKCERKAICRDGKVKCPDSSCVATASECRPVRACEQGTQRCIDGTCGTKTQCEAATKTCPPGSPIECPKGECVAQVADCERETTCTDPTKPFPCADGECRASQRECYVNMGQHTQCTAPKVICPSGTCVESFDDCKPVKRCPRETPKRCPDASCVAGNASCPTFNANCAASQKLCDDGVCRENCPPSDSCPAGNVECDDGRCVTDLNMCLCPGTNKMRCFDGSCSGSLATRNCTVPPFRRNLIPIKLTVRFDEDNQPSIVDTDGKSIGTVNIPAGALRRLDGESVSLDIKPVPRSRYTNFTVPQEWGPNQTIEKNIFSSVIEVKGDNVSQPFPKPTQICVDKDLLPATGTLDKLCFAYYRVSDRKMVCASNITISDDNTQVCGTTRHFTDFVVSSSVSETDESQDQTCLGGGNCNGNGNCVNGECQCTGGYSGSDCSIAPTGTPTPTPTPTASASPTPTPTPETTTTTSDASTVIPSMGLIVLCALVALIM
eukprot:TRINITY_DN477_c0_g1_i2.p1 TRINITY_DN477_c0_g1~~TRINITY_DN477_c0_g1_i2.p1  ORF type:complete len:1115 (-),score=216.79 TRINITY_DN477_c0_g1_i2:102-3446(-)